MTEYAGNLSDNELGFHRQPIEEIDLPEVSSNDANGESVSEAEKTLTYSEVEDLINQMDLDLKTRLAALEIANNMYRRGSKVPADIIVAAREIEAYLREG
jgi:hypothetical protein